MTSTGIDAARIQQELATAVRTAVAASEAKHGITIPWIALVEIRDKTRRTGSAVLTEKGPTAYGMLVDVRGALPMHLQAAFEYPFDPSDS